MAEAGNYDHVDRVNRMNPAASKADLGTVVQELTEKFNAALAKLDADAGVTDTNYTALHGITELKNR